MTADAKTIVLRVAGMFCAHCEETICGTLSAVEGVECATASYSRGTATVTYDPSRVTLDAVSAVINGLGYDAQGEYIAARAGIDWNRAAGMMVIIAAIYIVLQQFGLLNMLVPSKLAAVDMSYGLIFLVGLFTSVHCVAMCGGINLSQCVPRAGGDGGANAAARETNANAAGNNSGRADAAVLGRRFSYLWPSMQYNAGRLISYTLIGAAVGAAGAAVTFSINAQGALKLIAGLFMLSMGIGMLDLFPHMRRFVPRMPAFVSRWVGAADKKGPIIVGFLNGFLPCGPLQAMQIFALSTGSAAKGALSMALFCLGTVPLMFGLGAFSAIAGKKSSRKVMAAGAVMVAVLGLCMLSQSWNLFGLTGVGGVPLASAARQNSAAPLVDFAIDRGPQIVNSTLRSFSYPSITVEANRPVKWIIDAPPGSINGCNDRIFIREYGIEYKFQPGENVVEFTPSKVGKIPYTCWMGMIPGTITVVSSGAAIGQPAPVEPSSQANPRRGAACCEPRGAETLQIGN
ncbi:MAG: sulfite exporter TauE/SafE family protein [Chitinispirillales bacterium]|jgi:sulfite exporter TauE/SafE|nr:sulfite exporter TauE/SafE family protein [Chitinispirillales bacterium]